MQLPQSVKKFLEKPNFAVLATVTPTGRPQATPVWFLEENGQILAELGGLKIANFTNKNCQLHAEANNIH